MSIISIKNMDKSYGKKKIFDNFSLEVESGDYLSIMGDSGTGKTTLLNIIGMIDKPNKGEITICGVKNPKFLSPNSLELRRFKISYLFQNCGLVENENVKYNLKLAAFYKKLSEKELEEACNTALEKVGLEGFLKRKIYTLSGGEQQRVALAKIIIKSPELILADEPTGSLDATNRDYVLGILDKLNQEGKTIIVVTHDPIVKEHAKTHLSLNMSSNND